jgi:hypothetical protein
MARSTCRSKKGKLISKGAVPNGTALFLFDIKGPVQQKKTLTCFLSLFFAV